LAIVAVTEWDKRTDKSEGAMCDILMPSHGEIRQLAMDKTQAMWSVKLISSFSAITGGGLCIAFAIYMLKMIVL